jgi:hypothetical protein
MYKSSLFICIRKVGDKFIVYPVPEQACQFSANLNEENVWYFSTCKSIFEFARGHVFKAYDTFEAALAAISKVDPLCQEVYRPPNPPDA